MSDVVQPRLQAYVESFLTGEPPPHARVFRPNGTRRFGCARPQCDSADLGLAGHPLRVGRGSSGARYRKRRINDRNGSEESDKPRWG